MKTITPEVLQTYVSSQVNNLIPPTREPFSVDLGAIQSSLDRVSKCVSKIKAFEGQSFSYLNSGQYSTFIYFLARYIAINNMDYEGATKLFLLNKALNGIDLFYDIEMPNFFLIGHTVGMVFAKAIYGEYSIFHQGCTIGRNGKDRPVLEEGVVMYPNSSVIGRCIVRANTIITPGVQLVNTDTPGNCLVFIGANGRPCFKEIHEFYADRYFSRQGL